MTSSKDSGLLPTISSVPQQLLRLLNITLGHEQTAGNFVVTHGICCRSAGGPKCFASQGCLFCALAKSTIRQHSSQFRKEACEQYDCLVNPSVAVISELFDCHTNKPWWHYFALGVMCFVLIAIFYRLCCVAQSSLARRTRMTNSRRTGSQFTVWPLPRERRLAESSDEYASSERRRSWNVIRPLALPRDRLSVRRQQRHLLSSIDSLPSHIIGHHHGNMPPPLARRMARIPVTSHLLEGLLPSYEEAMARKRGEDGGISEATASLHIKNLETVDADNAEPPPTYEQVYQTREDNQRNENTRST